MGEDLELSRTKAGKEIR